MKDLANLIRSYFVKDVFKSSFGTVVAQVLNFIFNIWIARIYNAEDFGILAFYLITISIILVISCAKLDINIVTSKNVQNELKFLSIGFSISILFSILSGLLFPFLKVLEVSGFNSISWWWIISYPVSVFLLTGRQLLWMWGVKHKIFKALSIIYISENVVLNISYIFFSFLQNEGLLVANIISQFTVFLLLILVFRKNMSARLSVLTVKIKRILRYMKIQINSIIQGYLDLLQVYLFILVFSDMTHLMGYYFLCIRVLYVPLRIIILPITHVFFSHISGMKHSNKLMRPLANKVLLLNIFIVAPLVFIIFIYGPGIFSYIFGNKWLTAGEYASILVFGMASDMIKTPFTQIFYLFNKQKILNRYSLGIILLSITGMIYFKAANQDNFYILFWYLSIIQVLFNSIIIYRSFKMMAEYEKPILSVHI